MPYARVNMLEFKTREEMERIIAQLRDSIKFVFPKIGAFTSLVTYQISKLTISVYDSLGAADQAINQQDTHPVDYKMADLFSHEGSVNCFYVEEQQIANLLNSRS